jgi:L-aminopeptidase/D-esterase-like protein
MPQVPQDGFITDVDGIRVGHFTDTRRPTGCTVVLCEHGAVTGVDVRGSAPGTRETDLLDPTNTIDHAHAILLAGGSSFGLDAASGVMRYLEERGIGYPTRAGKIPIVPAAILYDLTLGDASIRPNADSGYQACADARPGPIAEGNVGAGAVNCVGNVIDPKTGRFIAGSRTHDMKGFIDIIDWFRSGNIVVPQLGTNTTIGVVATNAAFRKAQMKKIAEMAHDGMARAINPTHTPYDGDTLFAMATSTSSASIDVATIGSLAAEAVTEAILRAVMRAASLPDYPAYRDI